MPRQSIRMAGMSATRPKAPDRTAPPKRRMRGFEPVARLTEGAIRDAAGQRGFAVARLLTHWPEIVGEEIAALCRPVRMSHGRGFGATLVLLTTGPRAPLLEMRLPLIRDKVNACFGYNAVARISLTQTAAHGFAEGQASFTPAAAPPPPSPELARLAADTVAPITDPRFREALARLALAVLSRQDRPTSP